MFRANPSHRVQFKVKRLIYPRDAGVENTRRSGTSVIQTHVPFGRSVRRTGHRLLAFDNLLFLGAGAMLTRQTWGSADKAANLV